MKTKSIKGFTLIECLIALAILGIGSLVMAQIYANVNKNNLSNQNVNTSLAYQMRIVEEATGQDSIPMYFGGVGGDGKPIADPNADKGDTDKKPPHMQGISSDLTKPNVTITGTYGTYSYPVDIYVLLSRDSDNNPSKILSEGTWIDNPDYKGATEKDISLRYRYIVGHNNK